MLNFSIRHALCLVLLFLILFTWSCKKADTLKSIDTNTVSEAKKWLEDQHANLIVNWEQAVYNSKSDRIIVPLIWNALLDDGGLSTRKLSIAGTKTGNRTAVIVEIVPTKRYSLKHGTSVKLQDFEGSLGEYDLKMQFQRGEYYEKGQRVYPATFEVYRSRQEYASTPRPEGCSYTQTAYYTGGVLTVIGGQFCYDFPVGGGGDGTADNGTEPRDPVEWEIDEGDTWTSGGDAAPPIAYVSKITDSLHTPCFKNTLAMLVKGGGFSGPMLNIVNNVFHYAQPVDVLVTEGQLAPDLDGVTNSNNNDGVILSEITLNQAIDTAAQEYVAVTLLHEAIHAYMTALHQFPLRDLNNLQHQAMTTQYVSEMASGLQAMYPGMAPQDAIDLAWGGLSDTLAWTNMIKNDPVNVNRIIATNKKYRAGKAGTICK